MFQLDFEQPILEIEHQIESMEARPDAARWADELAALRATRGSLIEKTYSGLTPWQTVRVARHPQRPQTLDYVDLMCRDFGQLHGDRRFGDDPAIVCGFCRIGPLKVMLVGHQKGRTTPERVACHFGCAHPEGYRKALLKMKLAEKFGVPIVTLIDTPGAYPGIGSEQRGQAEAIAYNLREMSGLRVPVVCIVIGEGGSGGALGIGVGDRVAMMRYSWYSVISPEGCAAILFKEANEKTNTHAAQALALTAADNARNGLVDAVIEEPNGGAHRDPRSAADRMQQWIVSNLQELQRIDPDTLVRLRFERFRRIGAVGQRIAPRS
ncbi:MAG: acetyl-CoA carboxylase carboxyltransferase subunit alpha [Planctomycetota bacterium]|nr:acetyl-CoA carboxylase carboxyltransferase subunit alpha [Planctomycetota bacterium]MDA1106188.1 acetyl-CoA carboxylase carboxyltransferase subunit alpha [Planctomycetota bacterium]